jgi:hypothetical protein
MSRRNASSLFFVGEICNRFDTAHFVLVLVPRRRARSISGFQDPDYEDEDDDEDDDEDEPNPLVSALRLCKRGFWRIGEPCSGPKSRRRLCAA